MAVPRQYLVDSASTGTVSGGVCTTDASGDFTGLTPVCYGKVVAVLFDDTDIDAGGDVTITTADTGQTVLVKANIGGADFDAYPAVAVALNTDASALTSYTEVQAAGEQIKVVIASGGNTKSGKFTFLVEES